MSDQHALLLVDTQVGFFEGDSPVHDAEIMRQRIETLLSRARAASVPVIYIQHASDPEIDGPIHPSIAPNETDTVFQKLTPDSFHETGLHAHLQAKGISHLVLAGFQTELCIDTTTRRAWSMGYEVTVVQDAHSTFDFDDAPLTAPDIITHHNHVLTSFAAVVPSNEIIF